MLVAGGRLSLVANASQCPLSRRRHGIRQRYVAEFPAELLTYRQPPSGESADSVCLSRIGVLPIEEQPAEGDDGICTGVRRIDDRCVQIRRVFWRCVGVGKGQLSGRLTRLDEF